MFSYEHWVFIFRPVLFTTSAYHSILVSFERSRFSFILIAWHFYRLFSITGQVALTTISHHPIQFQLLTLLHLPVLACWHHSFLKKVSPSTMASHSANFNHRSGITISHQSFLTTLAHSLYHSHNTHTCISFPLRRSRQLLFEITLRRRKQFLRRFTHDDHP